MESFEEATLALKDFLRREGLGDELLWVFRDDCLLFRRSAWVKKPLSPNNPELARQSYEGAVDRGWGVGLEVACLLDDKPCCFIWIPEDPVDTSYAMLSKDHVKLSIPTDLLRGKPVGNGLLWWVASRLASSPRAAAMPSRVRA